MWLWYFLILFITNCRQGINLILYEREGEVGIHISKSTGTTRRHIRQFPLFVNWDRSNHISLLVRIEVPSVLCDWELESVKLLATRAFIKTFSSSRTRIEFLLSIRLKTIELLFLGTQLLKSVPTVFHILTRFISP